MANSAATALLREAFPETPTVVIEAVLKRHASVDGAAAELLQADSKQLSKPQGKRKHPQPPPRNVTWGQLTDAAKPPIHPHFKQKGQPAAASVVTADFPSSLPPAKSVVARPSSIWQAHPPALPSSLGQHPVQPQAGQHQAPAAAKQAVVAQLLKQHGWAGQELVAAVLQAAGGNADRAAALLADMLASDSPPACQPPLQCPGAGGQADTAMQRPSGSAASSCGSSSEEDESAQRDPYYRHRHRALQLTRSWQRAARGAASAYSSSQHSQARQLAQRAQQLRLEALAAHEQAAERIETENNRGNSLWELDLHGLHAQEALAALDRRIALLHSLKADGAEARLPAGIVSKARQLRVVVGRGTHSSGGDASIPRVVENHLQAAGLRYVQRLGAIDVLLSGLHGLT